MKQINRISSIWEVLEIIEIGEDFCEQNVTSFRDGEYRLVFSADNMVTERQGRRGHSTLYSYDPTTMAIHFAQSRTRPLSPITGKTKTNYRIVKTGDREIYLLGPGTADGEVIPFETTILLRRLEARL